MRPGDKSLASSIEKKILLFNQKIELPGISGSSNLSCLVEQMIDSVRRIKYIELLKGKQFPNSVADPTSDIFDPIKAALWHKMNGNSDEALWLIFLATHFGKNKDTGWELTRGFYGGLGDGTIWTWKEITANLNDVLHWLDDNKDILRQLGKFGNHRKYESLNAFNGNGTGATIASYADWIGLSHNLKVQEAVATVGQDPKELFRSLYNSMRSVKRFGRTARFDYLTMVGKLGLIEIEPDSTYMDEATGPKRGARLLFGGHINASLSTRDLNEKLSQLEASLDLYFGMQVLEDALCNWQKSPSRYIYFGG